MYSITMISKMFNLPTSTLRYYEKIGLLENVHHQDRYHRFYDQSHIDRLNSIECFKRALLPLSEIKTFFELEKNMSKNSEQILEIMLKQQEKTQKSIQDLQEGLSHLKQKIHFYTAVNQALEANQKIPTWEEVFLD